MTTSQQLSDSNTVDLISRTRRRITRVILAFLIIATIAVFLIDTLTAGTITNYGINLIIITAVMALLYNLIRDFKRLNLVTGVTVVYIATLMYTTEPSDVLILSTMTLASITSALVAPRSVYYVVTGLIAIRLGIHLARIGFSLDLSISENYGVIIGTLALGLIPITLGTMVRFFTQMLENVARNAQRTAQLLEATAVIGQEIADVSELNDLLARSVNVIRDRFGYYHVQIFLINEERTHAYLRASTGKIGEQLLARQHRLPLDARSVIGRVSISGVPVVTGDTSRESGHAYNELLPNTRAELALPIIDGKDVIGSLDVQSIRAGVFNQTEIQALQVMTTQLATAIRNVRLFERQEQSLREQQRLFLESETSLREIQRLNRQLTGQVWSEYIHAGRSATGVSLEGQRFRPGGTWTDAMIEASLKRRTLSETSDGKTRITVPIELRNQVIGAIEVETEDELSDSATTEMIEAIATRLALSLDNARLFEETQSASAQEQRVGEIVSQYASITSVDELLKITLEGLYDTLGAERGTIRLRQFADYEQMTNRANSNESTSGNTEHSNGGSAR